MTGTHFRRPRGAFTTAGEAYSDMFPTTIWTTIVQAGARDGAALERFARRYRGPILSAIRGRGWSDSDAEDLCQDVFVRLLKGEVLARADAGRGRFRSLLLGVTRHVILDALRRKRLPTVADVDGWVAPGGADGDGAGASFKSGFDQAWALALAERALARLRKQESPYHAVLVERLEGRPHDRNRLWIARRKLTALVRAEVAETCASAEDFADEIARLGPYLAADGVGTADSPLAESQKTDLPKDSK